MNKRKRKGGQRVPIYIQGEKYSKTSARGKMRAIIQKHRELIQRPPYRGVLRGDDYNFIMECFLTHPDVERKTNGGERIVAFYVGPDNNDYSRDHRNWCYYVKTESGHVESFSMKACFDSDMSTYRAAQINEALRGLITEDMDAFRNEHDADRVNCEQCDKELYNRIISDELPGAHVDHNVHAEGGSSFQMIKTLWLWGNPEPAVIRATIKGRPGWTLKDPKLRRNWQEYHRKNAKYRFLCHECNCKTENK